MGHRAGIWHDYVASSFYGRFDSKFRDRNPSAVFSYLICPYIYSLNLTLQGSPSAGCDPPSRIRYARSPNTVLTPSLGCSRLMGPRKR